jgi:hypothetical protein
MTYTNSFEEDRFLSTMSREAEAFKKLIDDRAVSEGAGFFVRGTALGLVSGVRLLCWRRGFGGDLDRSGVVID